MTRQWIAPTLAAALWLAAGAAQAVTCQGSIPASNPDTIYTVHADGTVTDTRTGLMWKQCLEGYGAANCTADGGTTSFTWADALTHAENHTFASHSDWRLPNMNELRSLVEDCRVGPTINDAVFPNTSSSGVWSGSPNANSSNGAWFVSFGYGLADDYGFHDVGYRVRLVRAGQSFAPLPSAASTRFVSENLPDGSFQLGAATKTWTFRNGTAPVTGLKAVRVSADAGLGISATELAIGNVAANASFTISLPVNPTRTGAPMPKSVWKLVDGAGQEVAIGNSASNTFWVALRTNRAPRFSAAQLGSIGGTHGSALTLPLLGEDDDGDALTYTVDGISVSGSTWTGTASAPGGDSVVSQLTLSVSDGLETATRTVDVVAYGANGLRNFFADVPFAGDANGVYAATHFLAGQGMVLGCGTDGGGQRIYCPVQNVTQAEALKVLLQVAQARGLLQLAPAPSVPAHFMASTPDGMVNYAWAAPYAYAAQAQGLIDSVQAWNPAATLPRATLARWIDKLLALNAPLALLEANGLTDSYRFADAAAFTSSADHAAALRTALLGYLGSLGGSFGPAALVNRGDFAVAAAKVLRAPRIDGLNLGGATLQNRFGRSLPTITHGQTLTIDGVQNLRTQEILMSGDYVLEEWTEPPANYVRVGVALPSGQALGPMRYVKDLAANPLVLDTGALPIQAATQLNLIVLVESHKDAPGQDVPRSGTALTYTVTLAIDFPDRDGDGVRDDLDAYPDDPRFATNAPGSSYPQEVVDYLAALGLLPTDPVLINGQPAGYTHGQALMHGKPPYDGAGSTGPGPGASVALAVVRSGPGSVARSPAGTPVAGADGSFDYAAGTTVTLTAQPDSGARFVGWSGACTGMVPTCQLTLNRAASAVAAFALNQGGGTGSGGGTPMAGGGTATVSASAPGGAGTVTAQASGGGASPWVFTKAEVQPAPAQGTPGLPAGATFPYGLVDFELALGQAGTQATVVLAYPGTLPPGARAAYYKYGRTQANPTPHWYVFGGAQVNTANNTVTLTLQDGGAGDDDLAANGAIRDPGGLALLPAGSGAVAIPTLGEWALALLAGLLGLFSLGALRRCMPVRG